MRQAWKVCETQIKFQQKMFFDRHPVIDKITKLTFVLKTAGVVGLILLLQDRI
jgi:hypothetical protein